MYYDLIASLPHLPHFERAERLPITPLRLERRLGSLRPQHAEQLQAARAVVRWRPERFTKRTDQSAVAAYAALLNTKLDTPLQEYIHFRLSHQMLLAALRRKQAGLPAPDDSRTLGIGPLVVSLRRNWDTPFFGLQYRYPWLPLAAEKLASCDALGLERLLVDLHWRQLTRSAEQAMFGFAAVMAFVLKWDILHTWIEADPQQAKVRFTQLIDKVTNVEGQ